MENEFHQPNLPQCNMKFYRSSLSLEALDNLSQDGYDDGSVLDPEYIEDRFRVDRKKLECMLPVQCGNDEESADEFFQRVMDETNTHITWPSKLKIGAKSKKDPHIKVIGRPDDVSAAREKVMAILDTKSNRVTLKVDVSHTEHSHVIGKGGNNIKRVMQETCCHIHFPDSNRGSSIQDKSNQVSIAGQPSGVENARIQIRELLPLVFMFEVPTNSSVTAPLDPLSPTIQHIQKTHKVLISFRQRSDTYTLTIIVRGSVCNSKSVKEATSALVEHLTATVGNTVQVSMQLEIATQHHQFMIGRNGANVKQIMQRTGATIHFPDPGTVTPQRKASVYITGSMDSVILARQHLIGCLPLVLMFDIKDTIPVDKGKISNLMEQLDVFISVKPKPKQACKSVIVKSIERNSVNMFMARLHLLNLTQFIRPSNDIISMDNNVHPITPLSYLRKNLMTVNAANTLLVMTDQSPHLSPTHRALPSHTAISTHWVPQQALYSPVVMVTNPSTHYTLTPSVPVSLKSTCATEDLYNPATVVQIKSPVNLSTPPLPADWTPSNFAPVINQDSTDTSTFHTLNLLGLSKPADPVLYKDSVASSIPTHYNHDPHRLSRGALYTTQSTTNTRQNESDSHRDMSHTPGLEFGSSGTSLFSSHGHGPFAFDYEYKKLMATKAIQKKPDGESRTPTDFWSGFGFSKSMPDSVIRDAFSTSQLLVDPVTPLQCNGTDVTDDDTDSVDRDPWKNSMNKLPLNPAPGEYPSPRKKMAEYRLSTSSYVDSIMLPTKLSTLNKKGDLAELFSKMGLGKYTDLFQQQEIDLSTFLTLTDFDLKELGISTFGARRKMLLAITDINKRGNFFSPSSAGPVNPFHSSPTSLSPHITGACDGTSAIKW